MPLENSRIGTVQSGQGISTPINKGTGIVYSIILDSNHPRIKAGEVDSSAIGAVEFRFTGEPTADDANLPLAYPVDKNFKTLPLKNEAVEILQGKGNQNYYRRIGPEPTTNSDTDPKTISKLFNPSPLPGDQNKKYSNVQQTGIARTNSDESTKYDGLGEYFKEEPGIHKLKLWEGDTLLESRFGQSIRFSAYNNTDHKFSPTIIIRNGENATSKKGPIRQPSVEDIARDGSIIAMTSEQYQLPFGPGTLDDKGKSDFETNPKSFKDFPSKLIGDQILLNSGRIIISAKNAEFMLFSKKNYGFVSDGALSIDNKLGINMNVGDDINITTNDRNINLITNNGKINAGSKDLEPMVKGQKLVDLLGELIDAIVKQNYLTPSGPSKIGPENVPTFNSIKGKLKTILSQLNTTA